MRGRRRGPGPTLVARLSEPRFTPYDKAAIYVALWFSLILLIVELLG